MPAKRRRSAKSKIAERIRGIEGRVTEDALLDGRVRLRQPAGGYRVAVDTPLLAAAVPARAGERVLELGCGVGAASLCLLARVPSLRVFGVELEADFVALARDNAALNGRAEVFTTRQASLLDLPDREGEVLLAGSFDHLFCNPPFVAEGRGNAPADPLGRAARMEGAATLADWFRVAEAMLRPKGSLTVVHRADRLGEILTALPDAFGAVVVFPLWPKAPGGSDAKAAKRILVQARKAVATPLRLAPGLVLHGPDGGFTAEAEAVLRHAAALHL